MTHAFDIKKGGETSVFSSKNNSSLSTEISQMYLKSIWK